MSPRPLVVVSQLPPPLHGSTAITKIFLDVLDEIGERGVLVDRRFSHEIGEVGKLSAQKFIEAPQLLMRLVRSFKLHPEACILFCTNRPMSFLVDVVLGEALRAFRITTINYVHTDGWTRLAKRGPMWRLLVKRLLGNGRITVALGESLAEDVAPYARPGSVTVIRNTVGVDESAHADYSESKPVVLFLSNLLTDKGVDIFVDMAIQVCKARQGPVFKIVGPTVDEAFTQSLRDRVRSAGVESRVHFEGAKFGADKWSALRGADLLVFPSRYRYEAQPMTILEAFSIGLPAVATDVGAIKETVLNDVNGIVLPQSTSEAAAEAVLRLLDDEDLRGRLSKGAVQTYAEKYSRETYAAAWKRVFQAVRLEERTVGERSSH